MTEESTTPDLVELTRQSVDALNRGDFDAYASFLDPDALWEATTLPASLEGATTIRELAEDVLRPYDVYEYEVQEVEHLGDGVVFDLLRFHGRLPGSSGPPNASRRSGPMSEESATPDLVELRADTLKAVGLEG